MTLHDTIRLVKSLTASEKRQLKLYAQKQRGSKDYLQLYNIIEAQKADTRLVTSTFLRQLPGSSLTSTTRYLSKILLRCLVESKLENDLFFQRVQDIMEVKILQERSLTSEALRRIEKTRNAAAAAEQHWLEYFTYRNELDHYAATNFQGISDDRLIAMQIKSKEVLKSLNHIHEHHTLFELLKYRLVHSGKISSDQERKKMNDLMLTEMTLVTAKTNTTFVSRKLHLLFQAFFFTNTGDYQTALQTFRSLNDLFEKHLELTDYPPMDYLHTLNGIIDSLYTLDNHEEIGYYIAKVNLLNTDRYPEYFRLQVRKIIAVYQLALLISAGKIEEAIFFIKTLDDVLLTMYNMISEEKQWELYFYCSLAFVKTNKWKKAHQYIRWIMQHEKVQPHLLICRAVGLLNIIVYYEQGESSHLGYEIRSYKKTFSAVATSFRTEKLILDFMTNSPDRKQVRLSYTAKNNLRTEIDRLITDKYEKQLLKYFDFLGWIQGKTRLTK